MYSGVIAEKPSEELFIIDTEGAKDGSKQSTKISRPLKADEVLGLRSAITPVDSRKRPNSKVTDGIIEPKNKRTRRGDWVTREEWQRLKKVAAEAKLLSQDNQAHITHDPWADNTVTAPAEAEKFDFIPRPKPIVAPPTIKHQPISLAANGKPIPAVQNPDAGISYNPTFEDWDKLLVEKGQMELEAEKQRLETEKVERERQALIEAAKDEDEAGKSDDESAWEGFESEYETADWLKKKRPERKTKAQRNKIKRRKDAERKARWEAKMKKREEQAAQIKALIKVVKEKEERKKKQAKGDDSSELGDDQVLRKRPLGGKYAYVVQLLY